MLVLAPALQRMPGLQVAGPAPAAQKLPLGQGTLPEAAPPAHATPAAQLAQALARLWPVAELKVPGGQGVGAEPAAQK